MADVESKSIPHELPSSHWLKATGQCVLERYLSATMLKLQKDIDRLGIWARKGGMRFQPIKCNMMSLTNNLPDSLISSAELSDGCVS